MTRTVVCASFVALLVAVGCTVGGPGFPTGRAGAPSTGASVTGAGGESAASTDCAARPAQTVTIDKTFWRTGFEVTLGDAVLTPATPGCPVGELAIAADFYNRGSTTYTFDSPMLLTSDGIDYSESIDEEVIPEVPGDRTGRGTLVFAVDDSFVLDHATLIFGGSDANQAIVPVGAQSPDSFVSLEPTDIAATGEFSAGTLTFSVSEAYVRADSPSNHSTLDENHLEVVFKFAATYAGGVLGGVYFSEDNFLLDLPNGTSVAPNIYPIEALDSAGQTTDSLVVGFTIPRPVTGDYRLVARGSWTESIDHAEGSLTFHVPSLPSLGE